MYRWTWLTVVTVLLAVPAAHGLDTVAEVEKKLIAQADVVKSFTANMSMITTSLISTNEMRGTVEVVRHGACFELIEDILRRRFDIVLPPPKYHDGTL